MNKLILIFCLFLVGIGLCVIGLFLLSQEPHESPIVSRYEGSSICGLSAVANICGIFGSPVEVSEVYSRVGVPLDHKRGISLLSCKRALEASGIDCTALRFNSIEELPEATPLILAVIIGKNDQNNNRLHAVAAGRHDHRRNAYC